MYDDNCVFCKIIAGQIPAGKVYEDDLIFAFHDINPAAPTHILFTPKIHMESLDSVNPSNIKYVSRILEKIPGIAASFGIAGGYRAVTNTGENGGQSVPHLHFHLLGGRKLGLLG